MRECYRSHRVGEGESFYEERRERKEVQFFNTLATNRLNRGVGKPVTYGETVTNHNERVKELKKFFFLCMNFIFKL
jgi:hypothetical protein